MTKNTIFLLISAVILTLVAVVLIPQIMVPDDQGSGFLVKEPIHKTKTANLAAGTAVQNKAGCDLSVYGLDCNIAQYLENNLVQTSNNGQKFCSYEKIGASAAGDSTYLNYLCQEFYLSSGKIYEGSGVAGPAKITADAVGGYRHWIPRDGSYFAEDINEFFPKEYQTAAFNPDTEKLAQMNRERGRAFFHADFDYHVEKTTDIVCAHDFDCVTPGEYLMQNRCPFTSTCLQGKCAVICPDFTGLNR